MADKSIKASDRRQTQDSILETSPSATSQSINITDIVSEGEIKGLVNGGESIFFNEDSLFSNDETNYSSGDLITATGATNSTTVSITGDTKQTITTGGDRFLIVKDALTAQVSLSAGGSLDGGFGTKFTLTASSGIFNAAFEHSTNNGLRFDNRELVHGDGLFRIETLSKGVLVGTIASIANANTTCVFSCPDSDFEEFESETSGTRTLFMDLYLKIASISSSAITLTANPTLAFTNAEFGITEAIPNGLGDVEAKYPGSRYQIATGTQTQPMFTSGEGTGSVTAALIVSGNGALKRGDSAVTITGGATLQGGQAAEVDEVVMLFSYPSGISHAGGTVGKIHGSAVAYRVEVGIQRTGEGSFSYEKLKGNYGPNQYSTNGNDIGSGNDEAGVSNSGEFVLGHIPRGNKGESAQRPFTTEVSIDLVPYQPFTDFQIKVTRLTNHGTEDGGVDYTSPVAGPADKDNKIFFTYTSSSEQDYNETSPAVISSCTAFIKEKLNYPFTALINTQFNSQQFGSVPKRSYELYGIKVQVPSNYVTREENPGSTYSGMESKYTRNTSTGAIEDDNQPWDGNFRAEKVYTNNPAWVFYDILVNNRYGLGGFLKAANIDKFSLYKIGKYCDELVPDGKGSKEPRFTANLYLQKATDAYKVLKDMATIFRGMLYWIGGEVRPVMDEKKSPVYNFSKANVVEGQFSYEGTGSKTRANQYVVTWNNPETGYKLEPLIVEDKQNIAETGRIISQQAVAFGCTSEGQALRYGRWKLWTAINQTEIVTFATGEGGAFLVPGDVVNIQDADDFDIPFSGRVNSYSESGSPKITLDRDIDAYLISSDHTYTISVIVPKTIAILNQDSATIGTASYSRGDTVVQARLVADGSQANIVVSNMDTSALNAANALDDSNNSLDLVLRESTIVQERPLAGSLTVDGIAYTVPAAAVDGRTTVQLGSALDEDAAADLVETLWVIKQTKTSLNKTTASSPKQYKIISVSDDNDGTYGIAAVEHYNEKFDSIENEFTVAVDDPVYPPEPLSTPPSPTGLRILRVPERTTPGEEVIVQWDAPTYGHIKEFEVTHFFNKDRLTEVRFLPVDQTQVAFGGIQDGRYTVTVRTISQFNKKSKPISTEVSIKDIFSNNVPRVNGIQKGCVSTSPMQMALDSNDDKTGTVFFANGSYALAPLNAIEGDGYLNVLKSNNTSNSNSISQSVAELSESDWAGEFTGVGKFASVFYDFSQAEGSDTDPLKLISWKTDTALGVNYWYDADKYAANVDTIWTALSGTVTVAAGSNKVVGTNTSFTGLEVTDVLKLSNTFGANIAFIESDTVMFISSVSDTAISAGTTIYRDELDIDYRNDFLVGEATYISSAYNFTSYVSVRKDQIDDARGIIVTSNMPVLSYDASNSQQSAYSNITLDIQALNYTDPEIKVTGGGYSQTNQSAESSFTAASSRQVVVHNNNSDIGYSSGAKLDFIVEARERNNTSRTRTSTYSITKTIDDVLAGSGFSASVSNLDHTFRMDSAGAVSSNDYNSIVSVVKAGTAFTFATSGTSTGTYGITISGVSGLQASEVSIATVNNNASLTLATTANILDTSTTIAASFSITIFDRGNSDETIGVFKVLLSKIPLATRGGVTITLTMTEAQATAYKGTLTDTVAQAVAAALLNSSLIQKDGLAQVKRIVPNDRITVKSGSIVSTRVYTGAATATSGSVGASSFSSVVVAEFDGSVIVDGTLSADKITSGTLTSGTVTVSNNLVLGSGGAFYTPSKTSFTDDDNGFYLDTSGNFYLGSSTNHLKYTASSGALSLAGNFSLAGPQGQQGQQGQQGDQGDQGNSVTGPAGQSVKTVLLFKKDDSTFGTTSAGSFSDPTNGVESEWTTTQPSIAADGEKVYMVMRVFSSDGQSPQDSNWSSPVIVAQREDGDPGPSNAGFFLITASDTDAPTNSEFSAVAGRTPVEFDVAVVRNTGGTDSKAYVRGSSAWGASAAFIKGDMVVSGTIGAAQITAGSISADKLVIGTERSGVSDKVRILEDKIQIFNGGVERVRIGNLS